MAGRLFCFSLLIIFSPFSLASYPLAPDPQMTPGELCSEADPDFESHRYSEKIPYCVRNVSFSRRQKIYDLYQIPEHCRAQYTVDHFIPLALGGNNSDANLWPEHRSVKSARHRLEMDLFLALSRGELNQEEAIEIIVTEKRGFKINPIHGATPTNDCGVSNNLM